MNRRMQMRKEPTLESKIRKRIKHGKYAVYVYADFSDLSDRDQTGRVLREMVKKNELIRFGQGIYVRTEKSEITGEIVPEEDIRTLAEQALKKLKVKVLPSTAETKYNNRESTQVPTGRVIGVDRRISRKMGYGGYSVRCEHVRI
jgi:hypothetical protein